MKHIFIYCLVLCILKFSKSFPYNSTIISKYAKVAVWGKTDAPISNRTSKSVNIWNHRLDPQSISPTTQKKNPSVVYQYPVYQRPEPKIDHRTEHVPGIGEVIVAHAQDRFEARPLFAYKNKIASATYLPPPAPTTASAPVVAAPVAAPPPATSGDLYSSPYSSYNPPDFKPDDQGGGDYYPPNIPDSAVQPPSMSSQVSATSESPKANSPDSYASLGPPIAPYGDDHNHDHDDYEPHDFHHDDHAPPHDPMAMYKQHDGPPEHPPKSVDDVYYPPDFPKDQIPDQMANGDDMMKDPHDMMMPPEDQGMMPPEDHGMMPPDDMMDDGKSNGNGAQDDSMGMAPPGPDYGHGHAFPQYLYDQHQYDHHVYEEIPHTTMAPAKEDKRVSSTNYSYYYLGRKLWYIPLYFSIYFIIYVTILILKSIARHKVKLKYKWYEHDSSKQARSMDFDAVNQEELTDLHHNVDVALHNATTKYNSVRAM